MSIDSISFPSFPYPGLRAFEPHENIIFFGRNQQVFDLIDKIGETHFIAVVGRPSFGKSSLVRTGFLPGLQKSLLAKAGDYWHFIEFSPSSGQHAFIRFIDKIFENKDIKQIFEDKNGLETFLKANNYEDAASRLLEKLTPIFEKWNILFIIDQFEELFSDKQSNLTGKFIEFILTLSKHSKVYIIITMRSGYIDACSEYRELSEAITKGIYVVSPLNEAQLKEAIEKPPLIFDDKIDENVVNELLKEMQGNPDHLPLLQHALLRMWRYARADGKAKQEDNSGVLITNKHYEEAGNISKALSIHADQIYQTLTSEQQYITQIIFKNLSKRQEGYADVRNPTIVQQIANQYANTTNADCRQIIRVSNEFRRQGVYLLKPYKEHKQKLDAETVLDISHESLIANWNKSNKWADEEQQCAEIYRILKDRVKIWLDNGQKTKDLDTGSKFEQAWSWYIGYSDSKGFWQTAYPDTVLKLKKLKAKFFSHTSESYKTTEIKFRPNQFWAIRYDSENSRITFTEVESFIKTSLENIRKNNRQHVNKWVTGGVIGLFTIAFIAWSTLYLPSKVETYNQTFNQGKLLVEQGQYKQAQAVFTKTEEFDRYIRFNLWTDIDNQKATRHWLSGYAALMSKSPINSIFIEEAPDGLRNIQILDSEIPKIIIAAQDEAGIFTSLFTELTFSPLANTSNIMDIALYPQTTLLGVADKTGIVQQFDLNSPDNLPKDLYQNADVDIYSLAVNSQQQLAIGIKEQENNIILLATDALNVTREFNKIINAHKDIVSDLIFIPNKQQLISSSYDNTAKLWDTHTTELLKTYVGHAGKIEHVAISPDAQLLATSSSDTTIRLWDIGSGALKTEFRGHKGTVLSAKFVEIAGNTYLISASNDLTLRLWDLVSGQQLEVWEGHEGGVTDVAIAGEQVYSIDKRSQIFEWDLNFQDFKLINFKNQMPASTAIAANGQYILTGLDNGQLCVVNAPFTQTPSCNATPHQQRIRRIVAMQADQWATVSKDAVVVWQYQAQQLEPLNTYPATDYQFFDVAFSAQDSLLYALNSKNQLLQIQLNSVEPQVLETGLAASEITLGNLAISADGNYLLSTDLQGAWLWQTQDISQQPSQIELGEALEVAFAANNQLVVAGYNKAVVYDYSRTSITEKMALIADERIMKAEFTPDGQFLATVSADSMLRVWDLATEDELFTLQLPAQPFPQAKPYHPNPVLDFDLHCVPNSSCLIAVPLTNGRLVVYNFGNIY